MDGWRKPKRKAVDPPGASSAPEPDAREPSDRSGGDSPATRADAFSDDAVLPAFANGDLAPMLARLREDLESTKRFFAAQVSSRRGARDATRPTPDETERKLLHTQDALLSATEKMQTARAERDAARAETAETEDARRRADEAFARAARAEADVSTELRETQRELERYKKQTNAGVSTNGGNGGDGGTTSCTTIPDTSSHINVVAALTLRAETAERRADATRVSLEERIASSTRHEKEVSSLRERVELLESALRQRTADQHEREVQLRTNEAKTRELSDQLASARKDTEDASLKLTSLEKKFASHKEAARAETEALRVAVDAAGVAAMEAERGRVSAVAETNRYYDELVKQKADVERCKKNARDAADATERAASETRRLRRACLVAERRLARVVRELRVVDDAAAHLRAVASGDVLDEDEELPDARETALPPSDGDGFDGANERGTFAFPASLAESRDSPTRRRSTRGRDDHDAPGDTVPGASPLGDSVPASAEAAPVTAPVPQRRAKRQRMTRQKCLMSEVK